MLVVAVFAYTVVYIGCRQQLVVLDYLAYLRLLEAHFRVSRLMFYESIFCYEKVCFQCLSVGYVLKWAL